MKSLGSIQLSDFLKDNFQLVKYGNYRNSYTHNYGKMRMNDSAPYFNVYHSIVERTTAQCTRWGLFKFS